MDYGRSRYQGFRTAMVRASAGLASGAATLALATAVPVAAGAQQSATVAASLVFDGVTVVDVEHGKLLRAQRVIITGNRIQSVGEAGAVKMPKGAQVVEAHGKYLIPGLWDLHAHPMRNVDVAYPLFLANGVTGIRDAGSFVPLDTQIQWRREVLTGTRVGPPRQLLSGQSIAGPQAGCARNRITESPQTCVADEADARRYVDSLKAAGADMIKPRAVNQALYFAIASEARRLGIPFGGHAEPVKAIEASDSGASIIDHPQYKAGAESMVALCWGAKATASVEQCTPVAERFRRNGTWWAPTLVVYGGGAGPYGGTPGTRARRIYAHLQKRAGDFWADAFPAGNWLRDSLYAEPSSISGSQVGADSIGYLHIVRRLDLPMLAGTDVSSGSLRSMPPGFALHAELAMFVAEGLTPLTALQSATLNPAKMLRGTDSLGTVAPGKLADLVLLDADPLADITNTTTIRAIVANGRYFDRVALDGLLAEVRAKAKRTP